MARYDKYEPMGGGFRAVLQDAWDAARVGVPTGVGLNGSGHVVPGAGNTGVLGVLVVDQAKPAAEPVDVMTDGEIVDCTGLASGTVYNAAADGTVIAGAGTRVGHTVEASRLVVRVAR